MTKENVLLVYANPELKKKEENYRPSASDYWDLMLIKTMLEKKNKNTICDVVYTNRICLLVEDTVDFNSFLVLDDGKYSSNNILTEISGNYYDKYIIITHRINLISKNWLGRQDVEIYSICDVKNTKNEVVIKQDDSLVKKFDYWGDIVRVVGEVLDVKYLYEQDSNIAKLIFFMLDDIQDVLKVVPDYDDQDKIMTEFVYALSHIVEEVGKKLTVKSLTSACKRLTAVPKILENRKIITDALLPVISSQIVSQIIIDYLSDRSDAVVREGKKDSRYIPYGYLHFDIAGVEVLPYVLQLVLNYYGIMNLEIYNGIRVIVGKANTPQQRIDMAAIISTEDASDMLDTTVIVQQKFKD